MLLKLSGPFVRTLLLIPVGGNDVIEYSPTAIPWNLAGRFAVRMDTLNEPPQHPDHARLEEVELPEVREPDWNLEQCVEQWRSWRRQVWLHRYLTARNENSRSEAKAIVQAIDQIK